MLRAPILPQIASLTVALLLALAIRLNFDNQQPVISPDGQLYIRIAENLVKNFCLSLSDPGTAECQASWGTQPPGYPIFIGLVRIIFGSDPAKIVVAQCILYAIALGYLMLSGLRLGTRPLYVFLSGLMIAVSPITIGVSHWILTETLAAASSMWVLAECCNAIARRQINIARVAAAVASGMLVRWDMIWIAIVPAVTFFAIYPNIKAIKKCVLLCAICSAPYATLVGRAAILGLPLIPPTTYATPDQVPPAILNFFRAAALSEEASVKFIWAVWGKNYSGVAGEYKLRAFRDFKSGSDLDKMFHEIASLPSGSSIPRELNAEFLRLSAQFNEENGPLYKIELILLRSFAMWTNREMSFGWGYHGDSYLIRTVRAVADIERSLFGILSIFSFFLAIRYGQPVIILGIVAFTITRTLFLSALTALEIRYLIPMLPPLEFAVIISLRYFWCRLGSGPNRFPIAG